MKSKIIILIITILSLTSTIVASELDMDRISKQIYTICRGGNNYDTKTFMYGISSGVRFTQAMYDKGKDRFDERDDVVIKIACKNAMRDRSNNRFSSKFKNALVLLFSH